MNINRKARSNFPKRRSIRLKGYDYSSSGLYFITICCDDKLCFFGEIKNSQMILNEIGNIVNECWLNIPNHFTNTILHEYIIMPNHIHGIIEITNLVGANQYSPENDKPESPANQYSPENDKPESPANQHSPEMNKLNKPANQHSPPRSPSKTIGSIVRGFKIGVTKWIRQNTKIKSVWQRNYYEIIINDETSYDHISDYIINNPSKWGKDRFYRK